MAIPESGIFGNLVKTVYFRGKSRESLNIIIFFNLHHQIFNVRHLQGSDGSRTLIGQRRPVRVVIVRIM